MKADTLCVGRSCLDVVLQKTDRLPPRYQLMPLERIALVPGGSGAIASSMLARLGSQVTLVSCVGDD
jgi:sugar/nucleoside kinase (ribokinase family)